MPAGSTDETTVFITDDDVPSVTVRFEQSAYTVAEGGSEAVKVILSADPERTVEVPISTTDMDGASSSDYSVVPQTVVFNSGDTEKTFSFSATDDTEDDDGERVRLNFGTLPPRVSSTSPSQAVVSITDDDVLSVTVSFEQDSYSVAEGRQRNRQGGPFGRPGADGDNTSHCLWAGRGLLLRLQRTYQRGVQQRRYGEDVQLLGNPGFGGR